MMKMKKDKKILLKNTFSLYIMNIIKLIFPLLTLPYLTRILSKETYGAVTYVKSFITYIQLLIDFGFLLSATKSIVNAKKDKKEIGRIVGDTLAEKTLLALLGAVIYMVIMGFVPTMKRYYTFSILYLISILTTIFILDFLFRGIEKMNLITIPYTISKSMVLVLTFVFVKGDSDLLLIPLLELGGNAISAVFSFIYTKKLKFIITFSNYEKWFRDIKESCLYFISNFATTAFGALTTVVAGFYIPIDQIACWGLCMQILSAAKALYNPITNSLYPFMIRKRDIRFIKKISVLMIIPMLIGSIIILLKSDFIMLIIGGEKYKESGRILKYLLPAFIFSFYSMLYGWPVLGAIEKIKETTLSTIIVSIIQILGFIVLIIINKFNLIGLAICCSISETLLFLIRYYIFFINKNQFNIINKKQEV